PPPPPHAGAPPPTAPAPACGGAGCGGNPPPRLCNLTDDGDTEAQRFSRPPQALWITGSSLAEAEIVTDHDLARTQGLDQNAGDEFVRREGGEASIEIKNNGKVDAELIHEAQLQWQWRQSKVRLVGLEVLARMRLKHDRAGLGAKPAGLVAGGFDQCLVTAMHAIEVPDRKRSAACRCWNIIAAVEDTHGAGI